MRTRPLPPIRKLVYSDLPAVLAIERRSFQAPWSLAMFVVEMSKSEGISLAAADESGLAGYLVCSRYADVWHVMDLAVAPEWRRQGVATRLLEHLLADGGRPYTLEVRASNRDVLPLYERLGFHPAGYRRRYFLDGDDALILWRESPTADRSRVAPDETQVGPRRANARPPAKEEPAPMQPQNNRPRDLPSLVVEAAALGDELALIAGEVELLANRADSLAREILETVPTSGELGQKEAS